MEDPDPLVITLLAGTASFFFSMAEAAVVHYSPPHLVDLARKRGREGRVSAFIDDDEDILLSLQTLVAISVTVFVLGVQGEVREGGATGAMLYLKAAAIAAAGLITVVRTVPLFIGRMFAEEILLHLRHFLRALNLVLGPLTWLLGVLRRITERLAARPLARNGQEEFEEELLHAVEEGEMEGLILEAEAHMIERALHLRDADVADVMTPRTRMFALEIKTPLKEGVDLVSRAGHSRVPVYRKNLDEIVGILYAKDLLQHWESPQAGQLTLSRLARKPYFVPETKKISQLLEEFKRQKKHLAVVLDEYGGTAGVITIEDIIEEIVGEIEDEFDESADVPLLQMIGEHEVEVDARVHVDDLAEALEVEIPSDDFDTVGGLVFTVLGRIPSSGDDFSHFGLHFTVLDANERSVNRVKVVRSGG